MGVEFCNFSQMPRHDIDCRPPNDPCMSTFSPIRARCYRVLPDRSLICTSWRLHFSCITPARKVTPSFLFTFIRCKKCFSQEGRSLWPYPPQLVQTSSSLLTFTALEEDRRKLIILYSIYIHLTPLSLRICPATKNLT